ncbi:hypothetical protein ACG1BZ_14885 [Microbulbifer sp. CNSA002]|uniref:hypothetical protein n=1 Tax=Microbulbifer sp. CNSA002 TaxID=3373604 RepID=UPI0039B432E0
MQPSQSVIILLLVANLVATVWFGLNERTAPVQTQAEKTAEHELPLFIDSKVRVHIYNEFVKAFNAGDNDALYDMFGPAAKAQFTKESAETEFQRLTKIFNSVESGAFTHSQLAGTEGNTSFYVLHYAVKFPDESEFGTSGTLKVTIAIQGSEYQIYGIMINAG